MPSIHAWQHIYSNVERDRSPTKTSGFQTLFYSKDGLSERDVAEIEERVFYVSGDYNPVKHIFFQLDSGKVAVGQAKPIEGRDTAGREGLYIAHTLVFEAKAFHAHHINPLLLFEADIFVDALDSAFAKGDSNTGDIQPTSVAIPANNTPKQNWPPAAFRQLVQYAINHKALASNRSALALIGSAQQIQETLRAVLAYVPADELSHCSFDTFFERGGNLSFTYCWSAGFQSRPRQPIYVLVDVDKQSIEKPGEHGKPTSSFGNWVDHNLAADQSSFVIEHKQEALLIGQYLDKQEGDAANLLSGNRQVLESVLAVNQDRLKALIRKQIGTSLPRMLTDRVFELFFASLSTEALITSVKKPFDASLLLDNLLTVYKQTGFVTPAKDERQELADVLDKTPHQNLESLLLIWGGGRWANPVTKWRIQSGVEEMDEDAFKNFWALAVPAKLVDPMHLLTDGKEAVFTSLIIQDQLLPLDEVPALVKALVKSDNIDALQLLAPYLDQLDHKQIKKIRKRIKGVTDISPVFMQTLDLLDT